MNVVELKICIERAYDWFLNQHSTQDKDWKLARKAVEGNLDTQLYNEVLNSITSSFQEEEIPEKLRNYFTNYMQNPSRQRAILLFIASWNFERWKRLLKEEIHSQQTLGQYLQTWEQAIHQALSNLEDLRNIPYSEAFKIVRDTYLGQTRTLIREQEHISTAKLLMVLAPDRFIAWDNRIAEELKLDHKNPADYELFNILVTNFINKNPQLFGYFEKRFGNYPIRRLIDMVLFTGANDKKRELSECASKLIEAILSL